MIARESSLFPPHARGSNSKSCMSDCVVEVESIKKRYGAIQALDGVSFHVDAGEIFGLLGPNGAGKTTLLSILACLLTPDSGELRLFERRAGPRERSIRRRLGIVPQELALYGELTARENLEFFGGLYGLAARRSVSGQTACSRRWASPIEPTNGSRPTRAACSGG